jgi:hypothetical protein
LRANWSIIVHGGAGTWAAEAHVAALAGVTRAVAEASQLLAAGGSAADAVCAAACILEDDPTFNSGTGSSPNIDGLCEMDACLMLGHELRAGGIANVQRVRNPILVARKVLEETDHALLAGEATRDFVKMNYDVIDVNLACPVKKIKKSNRGGHFLAYPDDAIEILRAVRDVVPANIPCTVKLRRAYDDTPEMAERFEQIFAACYEIGYAWAVVHCRTVQQKYLGPGKWEFLRDLCARYPDRVIFGSGDIWTAADIFRMHEYTGVHGVSVARGCIGNPWIFTQARALMR